MKERIHKLLAHAGVASRRAVEEMVLQGRISVNGRIVTDLPVLIDPATDKVEVDGERVRLKPTELARRFYFLLNKPKDVVCTNMAQGTQVRAIDLLPKDLPARLFPVGRLDSESKGLLLLTNDGDLTNRLTHPRYGVVKMYRAIVDGHVSQSVAHQMEKGLWLADKAGKAFKAQASQVKIGKRVGGRTILEITAQEGKNCPVRRMLAKLDHKVRDLTQVRLGPLSIEGISVGNFRELTPKEVKELQRVARNLGKDETRPPVSGKPKPAGKRPIKAISEQDAESSEFESF